MAKTLPHEVEICNAVKEYMAKNNFSYVKKYADNIYREGIKTNYRSHKFWLVHETFHRPTLVTEKEFYKGLFKLVDDISKGDYYVKYADSGFRISPKEDVPCI